MNQVLKVKGGRADAEDPRMLISARPPPGPGRVTEEGRAGRTQRTPAQRRPEEASALVTPLLRGAAGAPTSWDPEQAREAPITSIITEETSETKPGVGMKTEVS